MSDDIVEFIKTQLDIDDQLARAAGSTRSGAIASWWVDCRCPDKDAGIHADNCYECRVEGDNITIYDEGGHDEDQARHIARHDPAAVLAEVAAKRAVIELYETARTALEASAGTVLAGATKLNLRAYANALRALAAPYAERPGFKPEWRLP
jgi:hypothetical protein